MSDYQHLKYIVAEDPTMCRSEGDTGPWIEFFDDEVEAEKRLRDLSSINPEHTFALYQLQQTAKMEVFISDAA